MKTTGDKSEKIESVGNNPQTMKFSRVSGNINNKNKSQLWNGLSSPQGYSVISLNTPPPPTSAPSSTTYSMTIARMPLDADTRVFHQAIFVNSLQSHYCIQYLRSTYYSALILKIPHYIFYRINGKICFTKYRKKNQESVTMFWESLSMYKYVRKQ